MKRVGKGDEYYDVTLAQAGLQINRDAVQQLDHSHRQTLRALEAFVGRYPAAVIDTPAQFPTKPGLVPACRRAMESGRAPRLRQFCRSSAA